MCRRGPERRMQGMSRVVNRARSPEVFNTTITPSGRCWRPARGPDFDVGRQDRVEVAAGWVIRRWQPGQSEEGGLLAGGQYTNLSVRQ